MKILVTGGLGYVGSKLSLKLIENNYSVRVFEAVPLDEGFGFQDYSNFDFMQGDLRKRDAVSRSLKGMDAVVHLAAIVPGFGYSPEERLVMEVNYEATCRLVDLCKNMRIKRFIFSSTCGNYGLANGAKFATEADPLMPTSPYSKSKVEAERYVLDSADDYFHPTVLRFATVFGPSLKMSYKPLVNALVYDATVKNSLVVYDPESWRPCVHVDDAVEAITLVLQAPVDLVSKQVFNVGGNHLNYQKIQLVNSIRKFFPKIEVEVKDGVPDPRSYRVSFDKISKMLGFRTKRSLEEGIEEVKKILRDSKRMSRNGV